MVIRKYYKVNLILRHSYFPIATDFPCVKVISYGIVVFKIESYLKTENILIIKNALKVLNVSQKATDSL